MTDLQIICRLILHVGIIFLDWLLLLEHAPDVTTTLSRGLDISFFTVDAFLGFVQMLSMRGAKGTVLTAAFLFASFDVCALGWLGAVADANVEAISSMFFASARMLAPASIRILFRIAMAAAQAFGRYCLFLAKIKTA